MMSGRERERQVGRTLQQSLERVDLLFIGYLLEVCLEMRNPFRRTDVTTYPWFCLPMPFFRRHFPSGSRRPLGLVSQESSVTQRG